MNITLVTDAWEPQVNGVVQTYKNVIPLLPGKVSVIHPYLPMIKKKALPGYSEIELAINPWRIKPLLDDAIRDNNYIHIATEGPLGLYARRYMKEVGYNFTTCFHTMFPEFIEKRLKIPAALLYPFFRWFHGPSRGIFVSTTGMANHLDRKGFSNIKMWTRGVDQKMFNPSRRSNPDRYIIYVARASHEKNIDDFCRLNYDRKIFVGDGPYLKDLKSRYKDVEFVGMKRGKQLAELIANADVFVFPSKTDTFGIVLLESIACGTPVAAYPEPGPIEVIKQMHNGYYCNELQVAVNHCMSLDREKVYESSQEWTWERSAKQFTEGITR
jgi:glycosyltransferase involved in cell wall biosynthesis